jgi:hypothetical protein
MCKEVPVQKDALKQVPLPVKVGDKQNFFCREELWQLYNSHYGGQVFKSEQGARLRKCTFGADCRGAHSEEQINTLPHNHHFNNMDKSKLDLVAIYNNICEVMESSKRYVKHPTFKKEIATYQNMDFVELLNFWYNITCYHRKTKKELYTNENTYYKKSDTIPEFFLDNEDIVWPFERVTKMCQKNINLIEKISSDSDKPVIWDICCGSINCKEGCHNKSYLLCKQDLLTGQCDCPSNEELESKRQEIDFEIRSTDVILSKLISVKKKIAFTNTKRQLQNQLKNTVRMIHLTEQGLIPFSVQMEEYKRVENEKLKEQIEKKETREQVLSETVVKKKIKKPVF